MTKPRICIVPEYPLNLMTGGMQVQAMATFKALREHGANAELFEWCAAPPPADIYHFVGFPPYLASLATLLRRKNKPYICTILCGGQRTLTELWSARLRHGLNAALPGRREYHEAVIGADTVITITQADAVVARHIFGVPANRIVVVENGVDERFRTASPELWREQYGENPYLLCVGHIQRRKNQLFLLQAANRLRLPVVLIGSVLPGENDYSRIVEQEARANAIHGGLWLRELSADDPLLVSAYAACRDYVLLSHNETQPLSVMEAMAAGRPVLLGDAGYAKESPFASAPKTSRTCLDVAVRDLDALWNHGVLTELPATFTWSHVAEKLASAYERTLQRQAG